MTSGFYQKDYDVFEVLATLEGQISVQEALDS